MQLSKANERKRTIYIQVLVGHLKEVVPYLLLAVGLIAQGRIQAKDKLHNLGSPARTLGFIFNRMQGLHELKRTLAVFALEQLVLMWGGKRHEEM
jgi:hypothetical protein